MIVLIVVCDKYDIDDTQLKTYLLASIGNII